MFVNGRDRTRAPSPDHAASAAPRGPALEPAPTTEPGVEAAARERPVYRLPNAPGLGRWEEISARLRDPPLSEGELTTRVRDLARLASRAPDKKKSAHLPTLERWLASHAPEDRERFFQTILPSVQQAALDLPALFPEGVVPKLPALSRGELRREVTLSRPQVQSLLGHMFFCTLQNERRRTLTFKLWYHQRREGPVDVYMRALSLYFDRFAEYRAVPGAIRFLRVRPEAPPSEWLNQERPLIPIDVRPKGEIGDRPGEAEVIFANAKIGFGRGGTQEEIIFGMSPEMCVAPMLCDRLEDGEAVVISGALRVAEHAGFGLDLSLRSPVEPAEATRPRVVVAMDATPFFVDERLYFEKPPHVIDGMLLAQQVRPVALRRELAKARAGFFGAQTAGSDVVATGHWGCGAFGGHQELKAVIQWLASSGSGLRSLAYYTFGEDELSAHLQSFVNQTLEAKIGAAQLWRALEALHRETPRALQAIASTRGALFDWLGQRARETSSP